jgi:putative peptidoglycan lipid II flippase
MGLVRERAFAHYLGNSVESAALRAAMRIPNFLQNLLGEGVLSASFIPVYAGLIGRVDREEADRVASAVFTLLVLVVSLLVGGGLLATPLLVDVIASGFEGETRALTITLVRILFPGTGVLVLSAWCLGVLNSHRKFLLSYAAPVIWNSAIIAALLIYGGEDLDALAVKAAYGTAIGGLLQFLVQLPSTLALLGELRPALGLARDSVRQVLRSFFPAVLGRGVVQVSAFVDLSIASQVSQTAVSVLGFAQTLYLLPVSLFGMAVSAAELPEMSQVQGTTQEIASKLVKRIEDGLQRIAFFVVPSAVAFLALGDVVVGAIIQTGRFGANDTRLTWYLLAAAALGLIATTSGRLYASAFYAMKDTRTPVYFATARVLTSAALAYFLALVLPARLGIESDLGAAGIVIASGVSAWVELVLLRSALGRRIGVAKLAWSRAFSLHVAALIAAAAGLGVKLALARHFGARHSSEPGGSFLPMPELHPWWTAIAVLGVYGVTYFTITGALGVPQARAVLRRLTSRRRA